MEGGGDHGCTRIPLGREGLSALRVRVRLLLVCVAVGLMQAESPSGSCKMCGAETWRDRAIFLFHLP